MKSHLLPTNLICSLINMLLTHIFSFCHVPDCTTFQSYLFPKCQVSTDRLNPALSQHVHTVPQVNSSWTSAGTRPFHSAYVFITLIDKTNFLRNPQYTGTGCPERWSMPHPWGHSRPGWTGL